MSTLVTLLGRSQKGADSRSQKEADSRSQEDADNGYRQTTYRFPNGTKKTTSFFGLALAEYLGADTVIVLGTCGSQWGVLVEHLATGGEEEDARIQLLEDESAAVVEQELLDRMTPMMSKAVGCKVIPKLIPFGQDESEQYEILEAVEKTVPEGTTVSFDLTHGFRHLGMVGFLSAFMLERFRDFTVEDLWYGALDMTREGITPVLKLDGLVRVRRWLQALDHFDATGDYGVFASLLLKDGVREDKVKCLEHAAFYERTLNVRDAERKLRTFAPVLDEPLQSASGLFQRRLAERLKWIREPDFAAKQWELASLYLKRHDFVRAAMFGWEACVTRACKERGISNLEYNREREEAVRAFETRLGGSNRPGWPIGAYWNLKGIRNALAHGTRPPAERYQRMLRNPDSLAGALGSALDTLARIERERW